MPCKTHNSVAERFADMAIRIWKGDRSVAEDIRKFMPDREIEESEHGIVGRGPNGMAVGIQYGLEPLLALVQLGFLYAGPVWPFVTFFREAWKLTKEMWRDEIKKANSPNIPRADFSDRCQTSSAASSFRWSSASRSSE